MKKGLVVALILIVSFWLFAYADSPRLYFGSGNDKFTYGISKNADDQLTYSGLIEFDFDRYIIELDMNAYTDRGTEVAGETHTGRLDGVFLTTTFQRNYKLKNYLSLDIDRKIGLGMTGKFYFDFVQNFHHRNVGVDVVQLPYDWAEIKITPVYGLNIGLNADIGQLRYRVAGSFDSTIFFTTKLDASVGISFLNLLSFDLGYSAAKNKSDSLTMQSVVDSQSGLYMNISINASPLRVDWQFYPLTEFGYGTFSIDSFQLFKKATWKESDAYIDYGISEFYGMELLNAAARVPLNDKFSYLLSVGYVSGFPKDGDVNNRIQRNYAMYEVGINYTPVQWYITPFAQLQMGIGYYQLDFLNNMSKSTSAKVTYVAEFRYGFSVLPEYFVSFANTSYRLQLFGGVHFIPHKDKIAPILTQDGYHSEDWQPTMLSPYFGVGVSVGIDVPRD